MLLKFEVYKDKKHWCARSIGESIFTQGKNLQDLYKNIKEASELHFEDELKKGKEINILVISEIELKYAA